MESGLVKSGGVWVQAVDELVVIVRMGASFAAAAVVVG